MKKMTLGALALPGTKRTREILPAFPFWRDVYSVSKLDVDVVMDQVWVPLREAGRWGMVTQQAESASIAWNFAPAITFTTTTNTTSQMPQPWAINQFPNLFA